MPSSDTASAARSTPEARLMLVEDDANIVELLSASLRYAGFEVTTATNGHQALRLAPHVRPDLMIVDVMMPGLDGLEVVRRLGAQGQRCPVLFLTARDSTEDKITGLTVGGVELRLRRRRERGRVLRVLSAPKVDTTEPRLLHTLRGMGHVLRVPRN